MPLCKWFSVVSEKRERERFLISKCICIVRAVRGDGLYAREEVVLKDGEMRYLRIISYARTNLLLCRFVGDRCAVLGEFES